MANNAKNIIVGAGTVYLGKDSDKEYTETQISDTFAANTAGTYQDPANVKSTNWTHVGFTSEGVTLDFTPDYGEVNVDQLLDVAKIYKQGQKVMAKTTLTEATLENFLIVLGGKSTDLRDVSNAASSEGTLRNLEINGGALGYAPVERSILIVGPGPDTKTVASTNNGGTGSERIYLGYRALSMESVSVGIKRNEATVFPVTFRLLASNSVTATANSANALYGKVIDRSYTV